MTSATEKVQILGSSETNVPRILTPEAIAFISELHERFNSTRLALLQKRQERQAELDAGVLPDFLPETASIRKQEWSVAPTPKDLNNRRVEITGPVERKMMINAFNSGAEVFMADFEDSLSPTWVNVIDGQANLIDAVQRKLSFESSEGKSYKLNDKIATLVVRPRGWHLEEKHFLIDGIAISASLFDFGLYFFHNAAELIKRGSGPYFYLPKMESHLEAKLWNDVFTFAEKRLQIPHGTIRATVLIETILAAFEMDEILYELREHASGLNAGRWDYMFSLIKKLRNHKQFVLPDRAQVQMSVPFMRAYCQLLVKTCHRRGAHAMGGMAAFIPSRKEPAINDVALNKVKEDKRREVGDGFDGTWVAHPDLVPVAKAEFDLVLQGKPNQKDRLRDDVNVSTGQLLDIKIDGGKITRAGLVTNIDVAILYIDSWLRGIGAAAIHNLMEDAATAEISRAQIWQWIHNGAQLDDSTTVTDTVYKDLKQQHLSTMDSAATNRLREAADLLDSLVLTKDFVEFLTVPAYEYLISTHEVN
jgi:malate synthase